MTGAILYMQSSNRPPRPLGTGDATTIVPVPYWVHEDGHAAKFDCEHLAHEIEDLLGPPPPTDQTDGPN